MITKKSVLLVSFLAFVFLMSIAYVQKTCDDRIYSSCVQYLNNVGWMGNWILIAIPLFLFSLITYKLREEVFQAWVSFAAAWVPFSIVLPLASSDQSSWVFPSLRETLWVLMPVIFFIVSMVIIIVKLVSLHKKSVVKMKR